MAGQSENETDVTIWTHSLVREMFVKTADQNYVTARWAFMNKFTIDFFWLGLHAVEKYLKAILLHNGKSAKGFGHNIEKLYTAVLALDDRISFGSLEAPASYPDEANWMPESIEGFVKRMNETGNPHNRYMLYGWFLRTEDLIKLDLLVWGIRRYCQPFKMKLISNGEGEDRVIDKVEELSRLTKYWHIGYNHLIEKTVIGKSTKDVQEALLYLNYAFAPDEDHQIHRWGTSVANPPLAEWATSFSAKTADKDTKDVAYHTLTWVLDNIPLSGQDRSGLKKILADVETEAKSN